jgi:glycosyltransferase involved in cell wall biosynthesis
MKLTAMIIAHNERQRFLEWTLPLLNEFCDEVRAVCDDSTDGTHSMLKDFGAVVKRNDKRMFFEHEGRARQQLLEWTMEGNPTHILAIDADEVVADGTKLRKAMEQHSKWGVWSLEMEEVWKADDRLLSIRQDGGWKAHPVTIAFAVPNMEDRRARRHFIIPDRALASGRVPLGIAVAGNRGATASDTSVLHFGWTCERDRDERYQRYVKHDGGKFHANTHLESIMWDDTKVQLSQRKWPESMKGVKAGMLGRINR